MTVRRILKTDSVFGPLLIMLQTFFVANAYASMIIVPDDYEAIEMAVYRALEGDTVLIRPGVYTQYLGIFDEGITFAGEYIFSGDTTDINETILLPAHPGNLISAQYEGEDTLNVKGLTFWGYDVFNCKAIASVNSFLFIDHVVVAGFRASSSGSALYHRQGRVSVTNCLFKDNVSNNNGGAFYFNDNDAIVENSLFYSNHADYSGGAIHVNDGDVTVNSCVFFDNNVPNSGGAIYISPSYEYISLSNCSFVGNRAIGDGGAFCAEDYFQMELSQCSFENNWSYGFHGKGGAVYLENGHHLASISASGFYNNSSDVQGGAIAVNADVNVSSSLFISNNDPNTSVLSVTDMNNEGISVQVWNNHFESNGPGLENPDNYVAALTASGELSVLDIFNNDFINNTGFAVSHNDGGEQESSILCEGNYWGHESGPWHEIQNPDGLGDSVTSELDILPFSVQPLNSFTPPDSFVLLWPEDQTTNDTLPVRFAWEAATDPDPEDEITYCLEVADNDSFLDANIYNFIPGTGKIVQSLEPEHDYFWRVTAYDKVWQKRISEIRMLTVTDTGLAPSSFELIEPVDGSNLDAMVQFCWTRSLDCSSDDSLAYELQFAPEGDFSQPLCYQCGVDTSQTINIRHLTGDTYFAWRVRVEDTRSHERYSEQVFDFHRTLSIDEPSELVPAAWHLEPPHPNPFNHQVRITLAVPHTEHITAEIYDILGRRQCVLYDDRLEAGWHEFQWYAKVASGTYFIRIQAGKEWKSLTRVVLIR